MKIITAATSNPANISSNDARMFNRAVFGTDSTEMQNGRMNFYAEDNNTIVVKGALVMAGGVQFSFSYDNPERVTIESVEAGKQRIDVIGIQYELDTDTGLETAYLKVSKGEATSGTAQRNLPDDTNANIIGGATSSFIPIANVNVQTSGIYPSPIITRQNTRPLANSIEAHNTQISEINTKLGHNAKYNRITSATAITAGTAVDISSVPAGTALNIAIGTNVASNDKRWFTFNVQKPSSASAKYMTGYYYDAKYNANIAITVSTSAITIEAAWTSVLINSVKQTSPTFDVYVYGIKTE